MKTKLILENGSSRYGAQMGRPNVLPADKNKSIKLRLERLRFVDLAYDSFGAYWGMPATIYCAWDDEGTKVFARAQNRDEAKTKVKQILMGAKFFC